MSSSAPLRRLDDGLVIAKGPFGRPVIGAPVAPDPTDDPALARAGARLRAVNARRLALRHEQPRDKPNYFILVPTLRCNLRCDYCQVSRVAEQARGFDWDAALAGQVAQFLETVADDEITLEFQGGEPLLRLDHVRALDARMRASGRRVRTVICTNLQSVSEEAWDFLAQPDVLVSTSFDGTWAAHDRLRTQDGARLAQFRQNLERALAELGPGRVSLVSTIDPQDPPAPEAIIAAARALGIDGLFLRPINYQGFARKSFAGSRSDRDWDSYYLRFIDRLIEDNRGAGRVLGEYYFGYILRRMLDPRRREHVDLRNPSWLGRDYLVINETGAIFPTDEARMLHRTGQIDLRIGHVREGLDRGVIDQLNLQADNRRDPDCAACVYQAVCGRDLVDDLSRYGRVDGARHATRHCQRHLSIFDHVMRKLARAPQAELALMARMAGLSGLVRSEDHDDRDGGRGADGQHQD